ncbi:MAG TPA: serpin family protein, partial [Verrucomicrobiae bacterium]|nr:serpin family protein [Verrucomicrobiae bacterium]
MIRILKNLFLAGLMLSSILGASVAARSSQNQSVIEGNTAFALDLYGQLKTRPGNVFFSPYSISTCLAVTCAGARGDTEKQMSRVLHLDKEQRKVHASFSELQRQLSEAGNQKGIELSIANSLWAQKDHPFLPAFLEIAARDYQA